MVEDKFKDEEFMIFEKEFLLQDFVPSVGNVDTHLMSLSNSNVDGVVSTFNFNNSSIYWSNDVLELQVAKTKKTGEAISTMARVLHATFIGVVNSMVNRIIAAYGVDYFKTHDYIAFHVDLEEAMFIRYMRENRFSFPKSDIIKAAEELQNNLVFSSADSTKKFLSANLYERIVIDPVTYICEFRMATDWIPLFAPQLNNLTIEDTHTVSLAQSFRFSSAYSEKLYIYINGLMQAKEYDPEAGIICYIAHLIELFNITGTNAKPSNFVDKYLERAIRDILERSDMSFDYSYRKAGTRYKAVEFYHITKFDYPVKGRDC